MSAEKQPLHNTPAFYFPPRSGKYDVSPGLTRLGEDFGNGDADALLFQIDREFPLYRANLLSARAECRDKYVLRDRYEAPVAAAVTRFIALQLAQEHPAHFVFVGEATGFFTLHCHLTGDVLHFDAEGEFHPTPSSDYTDAFDALSSQVQEDLAIVVRDAEGHDRIAALHLCAPSRWSPGEKIGHTFDTTHAPVPGMEKVRRAAPGLVKVMVYQPPTVRFTWGIEFDTRLNLHPDTPPGILQETWHERGFTADNRLYLRVERQVIWGLPGVQASLFTIRVYLYDGETLRANPAQRSALLAALHSMSPESRVYKGLPLETFAAVIAWLEDAPQSSR